MTWDNTIPADNTRWDIAAGEIRDNWDSLEGVLGVDLDTSTVDFEVDNFTANDVISKGPIVDIRAFGAGTSESAADNSIAIQAAADSLTSGGELFVPTGTFDYDTTLTMLTKTGIVGTGPGASILNFTNTSGHNAVEFVGTGVDLSTGTPHQFCWMREVAIKGNASSGNGIFVNIAKFCSFTNVYSYLHGGDCFHIGSPPVTPLFSTPMGRISMINCHTSGGANSVYAGGGDIHIGEKCGFNDAIGIGIILEDMRISYLNGISGGSSNVASTHGIEIRSSAGNNSNDYDSQNIYLNNVHWEQITSGNKFVNVAMGGTTEFVGLSVTGCEYSPRAADGISLAGIVKQVYIDRNHIISRRTSDAAIGIDIGVDCKNVYVTDRNYWPTNPSIDNAAGSGVLNFKETRSNSTATANTVDATATNIMEVTIAAEYMETHGGLKIKASGTKTGVAGDKTIKLLFGSTEWTVHAAANNTNDWRLEATIINTSQGTQKVSWVCWDGATVLQGYETATEDTTAAVVLAIEGTCVDAGDNISHEMSLVDRF